MHMMGQAYGAGLAAINAAKLEDERLQKWKEEGDPLPIPRRLSLVITHRDFRPDYARVGVLFNGDERKDVKTYDADANTLETVRGEKLIGHVEPFWRYPETRQQRRSRERWEAKRAGS